MKQKQVFNNYEQLEAAEVNYKKNFTELKKKMNKTDRSNVEYVQRVLNQMQKRKIPCHMFVQPSIDNQTGIQLNSIGHIFKQEMEGGKKVGLGMMYASVNIQSMMLNHLNAFAENLNMDLHSYIDYIMHASDDCESTEDLDI